MTFDQQKYNRAYYEQHKEAIKEHVTNTYHSKKDDPVFKAKIKARREQLHYGIPASVIFRKTEGLCYYCRSSEATIVHHLDNDGRTNETEGKEPGKDPSRLIGVCRACHLDIHRSTMALTKRTRDNGYWSRDFDCCIECGTTERKHTGHGLCTNCYARDSRSKGPGV